MEALQKDIVQSHKAGLVLFLDKEQAQADGYMKLLTGIALNVKEYINVVVFNVDAKVLLGKGEDSNETLKAEIGSKNLPVFKYYPNVENKEVKSEKSYQLIIPSDGDLVTPEGIKKISHTMIEEMKEGIGHEVRDIDDTMM